MNEQKIVVEPDKLCIACRMPQLARVGVDGSFVVYECQQCRQRNSCYAPRYAVDPRQVKPA